MDKPDHCREARPRLPWAGLAESRNNENPAAAPGRSPELKAPFTTISGSH